MIVKLIDSTGAVAAILDVAVLFDQSDTKQVVLQLASPKYYDQPAKVPYKMEVYDNSGTLQKTYPSVLFQNYSVTLDEANVVAVDGTATPQALRFANNSFRFLDLMA
jgi:hypothetical protein